MDKINKNKEIPYFMCPNMLFGEKKKDGSRTFLTIKDVRKNITRNMNAYEKIVICYLLRCCNNGAAAYPSYKTIGEVCGMSERQAKYCIDNLVASEYIVKKNRGYITDREFQVTKSRSNVYYVNMDKFD